MSTYTFHQANTELSDINRKVHELEHLIMTHAFLTKMHAEESAPNQEFGKYSTEEIRENLLHLNSFRPSGSLPSEAKPSEAKPSDTRAEAIDGQSEHNNKERPESKFRKCPTCNQYKRMSKFDSSQSDCSDCRKIERDEKIIAQRVARNSGVPYDAPSGTTCAICYRLPTRGNELQFDYAQSTNTFRGYCCRSCDTSMKALRVNNVEGVLRVLNYYNRSESRKIKQTEEGIIVMDYFADTYMG